MQLYQPSITGSLSVSGSLLVNGPITLTSGTLSGTASLANTASYAVNAETLDGYDSSVFVQTGSFNTASGSFSTRVAAIEGKYITTGSNTFIGNQTITGSVLQSGSLSVNGCIVSTGQIVAQTINVQQVTSSIVYSCGSNIFGCAITDTQQMTGSVRITGSLSTIGNACVTSICSPSIIGGTVNATTIYGSTVICSPSICATGNSCFGSDVFVYGDLRMQGIDSFIWSPSGSSTGFTGFYDAFNNQVSLTVCNSSGHLLLQPIRCNVGIGTGNPTNKLHIVNNGNAVAAVRITDTNANGSFLVLNASDADAGILANGNSAIPLDIYTGGCVRMRISSTGNIGINNTSPANKLQICTTATAENVLSITNGTQNLQLGVNTTDGGSYVFEKVCGLRFGTADIERMRITSAGRVGIGTCNPTEYKLQVEGTDSYTGIKVKNTNSASGVWGILDIRNNCNDGLQIGVVGNAGYSTSTNFYNATYIESYNQRLNLRTYNDFGITIGTNSNVRMCILNTGEAVFACQVCAPSGIRFAGGSLFCNYETSTWTPFISNLSTQPTVSYSSRTGTYTRIGNMAYVFWDITVSSLSGGSGPALICNLPFYVSNSMAGYSVGQYRDATLITASGGSVLKGFAERGQSYIYLQYDYTGACGFGSTPTGVTFNSSGRITGYIIYQV